MFGPAHPEPEVFLITLWDKSLGSIYSLSYNSAFEHENPNTFYFHLHDILLSFHLPCTG